MSLPPLKDIPIEERPTGYGSEYILIQRAKLGGMKIDGSSGDGSTHEDAETVAAIVANLPERLGGRQMALSLLEFGKSGLAPECYLNVTPKLVPCGWNSTNMHGALAKSEVLESRYEAFTTAHPKFPNRRVKRRRLVEVRYTPCRWEPTFEKIAANRRYYGQWWAALDDVRANLQSCQMLAEVGVSDEMPPKRLWTIAS